MKLKALAGIFGALLMLSALMAIFSTLTLPQPEAFSQADLAAPSQFTAPGLQPMPAIEGNWIHSPNISVMISVGNVYEDYGGSIRIEVRNNDTREIFLQTVAFTWTTTGQRVEAEVNEYIAPGEHHTLKAMAIPGPALPGEKYYQLSLHLLIFRGTGWFQVSIGMDDWVDFSEHALEVLELTGEHENPIQFNTRQYYKRVNDLVDLNSSAVASAAEGATQDYGTEYNVAMVCAVFDYLDQNCVYTEDPGTDAWYSPDETLNTLTGDCEDYAMLIAAMVDHLGGASRVYLTQDHAFAAVYIGNTTQEVDAAKASISEYYGSDLEIHTFHDDTGYWLNVDPLGSFYAGGFAVGESPTGYYAGQWNSTFEESDLLHAIDVTGQDLTVPMWFEPNFWMGMMLATGFLTVLFLLTGGPKKTVPKTMCHICGQEVQPRELYTCPTCHTTFHRQCAFNNPYCMTCQKPINFPPPPND